MDNIFRVICFSESEAQNHEFIMQSNNCKLYWQTPFQKIKRSINITKRIKKYWLLTWGYYRYFRRLYISVPPKPPEAVAFILKV